MPNTIAENLQRLQTARTNISSAITNKGIILPEDAGFENFASAIDSIKGENIFTLGSEVAHYNYYSTGNGVVSTTNNNLYVKLSPDTYYGPEYDFNGESFNSLIDLKLNDISPTYSSFFNNAHVINISFDPQLYFNYYDYIFKGSEDSYNISGNIGFGIGRYIYSNTLSTVSNTKIYNYVIANQNIFSFDYWRESYTLPPFSFNFDIGNKFNNYTPLTLSLYLSMSANFGYKYSSYFTRLNFKANNLKITLIS